jgi:hypothetical protein
MVNQADTIASHETRMWYQTKEFKPVLAATVARVREHLDSSRGDQRMEKLRSRESELDGKFRVILGGALLMRAGARVKSEGMQHLRDLVCQVDCGYGFALPLFDWGFREPGKAQFLAALDNYVAGTTRNYHEPSCFTCEKFEADLGLAPLRCAHCTFAWYCSKALMMTMSCARRSLPIAIVGMLSRAVPKAQEHWQKHKSTCKSTRALAKVQEHLQGSRHDLLA